MKLYIDIDGVLLCNNVSPPQWSQGATEFITYAVAHFDCHWLTTHCNGDAQTAVSYLRQFAPDEILPELQQIRPASFDVYKTDALPTGQAFYWIDDAPMAGELQILEQNNQLDCWLEVNVNHDPQSLLSCLAFLQRTNQP